MEREKLRIILDIFVIVCLLITVIIMGAFIYTVITEGGQCVMNPAQYYININNISNICEHCMYSNPFSP